MNAESSRSSTLFGITTRITASVRAGRVDLLWESGRNKARFKDIDLEEPLSRLPIAAAESDRILARAAIADALLKAAGQMDLNL
jgi:hypothetical protein